MTIPRRMLRLTLVGFAVAILLLSQALLAQEAKGKGEPPQFTRMKTLVGSWQGVDPGGKPIDVSYKLVSEGTAIMELLGSEGHAESMVTMYHPDREGLMMTHYCSMGNQPRLKLDKARSTDSTLVFTFHDVTNMQSPEEAHIHGDRKSVV